MATVRRSFSEVGHAAEKMGRALTLGVTTPLAALGALSVRSATQLDSLKRGLTSVAGSSEEAEKQLGRLAEIAKLPGLGFREAIQGSIRLQAAGFSASLAEDALRGFANALATVGGSQADLDRVTRALSQIAAKGKVSAEEINQLAETIPQIRVVMKDAFGTANTEELQKLGIEAETFIQKVTDSLLKLEQVTSGPQKAFEDLQDAVFRASAALGEKLLPAVLPMVEGLARMLEQMRGLNPDTVKWGIAIAAVAAVMGPLLIVVGSMTSAVTALATALSIGLLPLIGIGGGVVLALTALGALFLKNGQDSLEAAAGVDALTNSYKGLSKAAAEFELGEAIRRQGELRAQIAATPATVQRRSQSGAPISIEVDNEALAALNAQYELANEHIRVLSGRLTELRTAANATGTGLAVVTTSAEEAAARLEAFGREVEQLRGKMAKALAHMRADLAPQFNSIQAAIDRNRVAGIAGAPNLNPVSMSTGAQTPFSVAGGLDLSFLSALKLQITGLAASFGPLALAAAVLAPVMEGLAPVFEILKEPLRTLGQLIGLMITPALRLLEIPLKLAVTAVSYFTEALGYAQIAFGKLIDALPFISGSKIIQAGRDMVDGARAARNALNGLAEVADTLTFGLPQGFRVLNLELAKFTSSKAVPYSGSAPVGAGGVTVHDNRPTTINVYQQPGEDQDTFVRKIREVIVRREREMGLTYAGNPYALLPGR